MGGPSGRPNYPTAVCKAVPVWGSCCCGRFQTERGDSRWPTACNTLSVGLIQHGALSAISLSGIYSLARAIREPSLRNLRLVSFAGPAVCRLHQPVFLTVHRACLQSCVKWQWVRGFGDLIRMPLGLLPPEVFQALHIFYATMTWYWTRWMDGRINRSKKQQNTERNIF